ncbi:hypothetical protein AB0H77_20310 [Streptomyces sp. NPDC050844]|uniref:hypothetical protein n=1 Tax=Streptomyces sp. NPDC050844 TaxID=3155790 RepID=UPI0033FE6A25
MATVGWAAAVVIFIGGLFFVVEYVLDRIPSFTDRAVAAVRALRRLRDEITRDHDEKKTAESSVETEEKEPPAPDA